MMDNQSGGDPLRLQPEFKTCIGRSGCRQPVVGAAPRQSAIQGFRVCTLNPKPKFPTHHVSRPAGSKSADVCSAAAGGDEQSHQHAAVEPLRAGPNTACPCRGPGEGLLPAAVAPSLKGIAVLGNEQGDQQKGIDVDIGHDSPHRRCPLRSRPPPTTFVHEGPRSWPSVRPGGGSRWSVVRPDNGRGGLVNGPDKTPTLPPGG